MVPQKARKRKFLLKCKYIHYIYIERERRVGSKNNARKRRTNKKEIQRNDFNTLRSFMSRWWWFKILVDGPKIRFNLKFRNEDLFVSGWWVYAIITTQHNQLKLARDIFKIIKKIHNNDKRIYYNARNGWLVVAFIRRWGLPM